MAITYPSSSSSMSNSAGLPADMTNNQLQATWQAVEQQAQALPKDQREHAEDVALMQLYRSGGISAQDLDSLLTKAADQNPQVDPGKEAVDSDRCRPGQVAENRRLWPPELPHCRHHADRGLRERLGLARGKADGWPCRRVPVAIGFAVRGDAHDKFYSTCRPVLRRIPAQMAVVCTAAGNIDR